MRLALTELLLVLCLWVSATTGFAAAEPAILRESCDEACHSWLADDLRREVLADIDLSSDRQTVRVRYGADWLREQPCPEGRQLVARRIVGFKHSSAFLPHLFNQGFCPRVVLNDIPGDAPYLVSPEWNTIVFDSERARLLTREQYSQWVVPAVRQTLASQIGSRWQTLRLFVGMALQHADLLASEIAALLADPAPSVLQETRDGNSSKATNVLELADAAIGNGVLIDTLLDNLDADSSLATRPGYRRLIDNLAGISPHMPTGGSPPVCANVDRIARHLPWGSDPLLDAKFLATLSRCEKGNETLLERSLSDDRAVVVATAIRVWWVAATNGHSVARDLAPKVMKLITDDTIPAAGVPSVWCRP